MKGNNMKAFFIKLVNLLLICGVLVVYQKYADGRAVAVSKQQQKEAEAAKAWQLAGGQDDTKEYKDGTYEGKGTGFGGEIKVQVKISEGQISSCEIMSAEKETPEYLSSAEKLLDDVVTAQSAEVDTVSGATLSSNGILTGIQEALQQAEEE